MSTGCPFTWQHLGKDSWEVEGVGADLGLGTPFHSSLSIPEKEQGERWIVVILIWVFEFVICIIDYFIDFDLIFL